MHIACHARGRRRRVVPVAGATRCSASGRTARRWRPATPARTYACSRCGVPCRRSPSPAPGSRRCGSGRGRVPSMLEPWELDGIPIEPVPFLAPPRPVSYGTWGWWMAPTLARALARQSVDVVHAHSILPPGHAVHLTRPRAGRARVVSTHGPDVIHVAEAQPVGAPGDGGDAARRRPRARQLLVGRAPLPRARRPVDRHRGRAPGRRSAGRRAPPARAADARHRRPPRRPQAPRRRAARARRARTRAAARLRRDRRRPGPRAARAHGGRTRARRHGPLHRPAPARTRRSPRPRAATCS